MFLKKLNERVVCEDGFSFSCQANENANCNPRISNASHYTEVEVGFPSMPEPLLAEYKESPDTEDSKSVFPYVPSDIVHIVITKHGGIRSGEVPRGVPVYGVTHCRKEEGYTYYA